MEKSIRIFWIRIFWIFWVEILSSRVRDIEVIRSGWSKISMPRKASVRHERVERSWSQPQNPVWFFKEERFITASRPTLKFFRLLKLFFIGRLSSHKRQFSPFLMADMTGQKIDLLCHGSFFERILPYFDVNPSPGLEFRDGEWCPSVIH